MALQFLTRLPVPGLGRLDEAQARDALSRAMGWLPLVGTLIGLVTALVFLAARLLWPPLVATILALAVEARLTGAFHEDAVADFCDGFGGGRTAEDVHRILKDSRIGSYGALGLGLALLLRVATTASLAPAHAAVAIIGAATMARLWGVAVLAAIPPAAGGSGVARAIGAGRPALLAAAALAALPGLLPVALVAPMAFGATLFAGAGFLLWFGRLLRRRLGGSTGDCLGFAAYAGQLALLLAMSAGPCYGCR
jgi:adenosylcobinamide-GDP ribazoletransferase